MRCSFLIGVSLVLVASVVQANGPAAHIFEEDGCAVGWLGCATADAIAGDAGWTCPADRLGVVMPTGDEMTVVPNEPNGLRIFHCKAKIYFGEVVTTGSGGTGEAVVVHPATICAVFPNACNGNGSVRLTYETTGGFPCVGALGPTSDYQLVVTPSGNANLTCFWPDPRPGNQGGD